MRDEQKGRKTIFSKTDEQTSTGYHLGKVKDLSTFYSSRFLQLQGSLGRFFGNDRVPPQTWICLSSYTFSCIYFPDDGSTSTVTHTRIWLVLFEAVGFLGKPKFPLAILSGVFGAYSNKTRSSSISYD